MNEPKKFTPKALDSKALDVPIDPKWKVMAPEDQERLRAQAQAEHERFDPRGSRMRKRFLRCVLGTAVGFAILAWVFCLASWRTLAIFGGLGAVLGAFVAWLRPRDVLTALLYTIAAFVGAHFIGASLMMTGMFALLAGSIGMLIGRSEEWRAYDGD